MAKTVGGWFSNPYGTNGSVNNPSPWNGINPFGHQISGPAWNSQTTYRPRDPNELQNGWSFTPNFNAQHQRAPSPERSDMGWQQPKAPPQLTQAPIPMVNQDRWGGGLTFNSGVSGVGSGGPGGFQHLQSSVPKGQAPDWKSVPLWQGAK